jgi:HK97 family phage prohead protease
MTIRALDRAEGMRGLTERVLFRAAVALTDVDTTTGFTMLEGRAAPYGVWTNRAWFLESFGAGLFDKSIGEAAAALPLLLWHDGAFWPIGSSAKWESRNDGLWGTWRLDTGAEAQRAAQLAKDGHLSYLSVGYQPTRSTWQMSDAEAWDPANAETLDRVTRDEARLVETSLVSTPAFASAQVTLVRSAERTSRPRLSVARPYAEQTREWLSTIGN